MAKVSSLWVGNRLGIIQQISLASFVYYGHEITLYVYDLNIEVPPGVIKKDASLIVPKSKLFYHHGQLAAFSDYFRYKMILKTGEMWVDADTVCLNKYFFDDSKYVFIRESKNVIAGGILKLPKDSQAIKDLNTIAELTIKKRGGLGESWGSIGPDLVTKVINHHNLSHYAIHKRLTNYFSNSKEAIKFWDPKYKASIINGSRRSYCLTPYNGGLTSTGFDKEKIVKGSAIEYFYKKFIESNQK